MADILMLMPKYSPVLDDVFHALADPTRRSVVERLGTGPVSTSELARTYDMALPSFTQHLGVLERCGLVTSEKRGRVRTYRLVPDPLDEMATWMRTQREVWERRLDQLDDYLITMKDQDSRSRPR
jgi:DNA-binding transcriptional ArsR family regulator